MGLSGPDENAVVLRRRDGLAETRCCHRSWPLWARNGHAKPGFQEPLTLILGQAPSRPHNIGTLVTFPSAHYPYLPVVECMNPTWTELVSALPPAGPPDF